MERWDQPPAKAEVEASLKSFFDLLRSGQLDQAEAAVAHAEDDWESQLWSLWQDTYLVDLEDYDEEVADDSFEGRLWRSDLKWLRDLGIDETFHWDEEGEHVDPEGEHLFVNLTYKGEILDVSGDFRVAQVDGAYQLIREIIHMA